MRKRVHAHARTHSVLETQSLPIIHVQAQAGAGAGAGARAGAGAVSLRNLKDVLGEGSGVTENMVRIPGGVFDMGAKVPMIMGDGEGPQRRVTLSSFMMDETEVSNAQFAETQSPQPLSPVASPTAALQISTPPNCNPDTKKNPKPNPFRNPVLDPDQGEQRSVRGVCIC